MPLNEIISAIASFASPILKDKIQRNETVIKLLQQFKLDPEHPPSDFSGVYAYALVEYGVGKPRQLLEIFRHEVVKQAFRPRYASTGIWIFCIIFNFFATFSTFFNS